MKTKEKRSKLDILCQILLGIPGLITLVGTIGCTIHFLVTTMQEFHQGNEHAVAAIATGVFGVFLIPFVILLLIQGVAYVISLVLFLKRQAMSARVFGMISGMFGIGTVLAVLVVIAMFFLEYPGIIGLVVGLTAYCIYLLIPCILVIVSMCVNRKKEGK